MPSPAASGTVPAIPTCMPSRTSPPPWTPRSATWPWPSTANTIRKEVTVTCSATEPALVRQGVDEHAAPNEPSVDEAHQLMQAHRVCATHTCPARQAALATLIAEGRIVLAGPPADRRRW